MAASAVTPLLSNHQTPLRQQKGYSIIELSIALAIISIILVTALAGVQRILRSNNTNEDLKNINLLASKLTVMLSNVPTTAGIVQANLVNLRVFEGFRVNANVVTNAFNGNITVAPNTAVLGIDWNYVSETLAKSNAVISSTGPSLISGTSAPASFGFKTANGSSQVMLKMLEKFGRVSTAYSSVLTTVTENMDAAKPGNSTATCHRIPMLCCNC